ncbi:Vacuolar protein sorting-associated protein 13A [Melipona quadrifasciata]|uniref:Vacuolar protein sorting-associated protein 13A n=1 Tax=Melipona quadrifasciata TaxID=166423 RepID=A0A0M9A7W5_9HYME|nr:Vacuolar protein sorting-associated protein 13A [Melipona quadrifasciata]
MQYGPAVQFGIGSILLVDKTNAGVTGSYLELISTEEPHEVFVLSYRKVKSNCPDFKSHFKSIERSLVVNILNVNINLHRPALLKIRKYCIFENNNLLNFMESMCHTIAHWKAKEDDPPIPPGAIKLNYSARLSALIVRFCDKDLDLIEIQILGLENDCIYTANERMVLRAHLRHLSIEDLNEDTLYSKEPIVEPVHVHFDIKRKTEYRSAMEFQTCGLFNVQGSMDFVYVNLSQKDLKSGILVWKDNISKIILFKDTYLNETQSAMTDQLSINNEDAMVLSSPVRDLNRGLCRLTFGEVINTYAFYSDKSLKMKLSLQSCLLQDTRKDSQTIRKIIQSPAKQIGMQPESCISISMSPIVDVTYTRTPAGEKCYDALIQEVRVNLSLPFVLHLIRDVTTDKSKLKYAQYFTEEPDATVSVRIHKPEILLFGNLRATNAHVILLQAEVSIESSRHSCSSSIIYTLSDVRAKSKKQGNYSRHVPFWLLRPCDIEICRKEEAPEFNVNYTVTVNKIDVHLSAEIMHTFINASILNEATSFADSINVKSEDRFVAQDFNMHNLWTPKKISNIPYKKLHDEYSMERFPVIKMESVITVSVNDWLSFDLESSVKLHAFCYNMDYKNWEPLIDLCSEDDASYKSWELTIKVVKKKNLRNTDQDVTDMVFINPDHLNVTKSSGEIQLRQSLIDSDTDDEEEQKKFIRTSNYLFNSNSSGDEESDSDDSSTNEDEGLELTPECNVDSYIIASAFQQAASGIPTVPTGMKKLNLQNDIGHESRIELLVSDEDNENTTRVIASQDYHDVSPPASIPSSPEAEAHSELASPQLVNNEMDFTDPNVSLQSQTVPMQEIFEEDSSIGVYKTITGEVLRIVFREFEDVLVYCPKRQGCNLISLRPSRHEVRYHLVIEATINNYLYRTITVRSPLLFRNETSYALGLYYKKSLLDKLGLTCIGKPTNPFDDNIRMTIIEPDSTYSVPLYIAYHFPVYILPAYLEKYQVSEEGIYWKELSATTNVIKDVCCKMKDDESNSVFYVKVSCNEIPVTTRSSCQVPNYLISIHPPFSFNNQLPFVIDVHIPAISYEVKIEPGERINVHSLNCNTDIQFVFKVQNYLGVYWTGTTKLYTSLEKKFVVMNADGELESTKPFLLLRAHQSEWSLPFGLEGITSMSLIVCKDTERGRKYRILTEIESSRLSPNFTKIITFLPYFYITNKMKRILRFMEENDQADLWNDLLAGQTIPFWPVTESMRMRIKWRNSQLVSQHFSITHLGKTVLRMDNGSAVSVEIKGGVNSPYHVTFQKYTAGDIPVRIDNFCDDLFLKISQCNLGQVVLINPFQSLLYTWDDPTKPRELVWNVYNNKKTGYNARFERDGYGQEVIPLVIVDNSNNKVSSSSKSNNKLTWLESKSGSFNDEGSSNDCNSDAKSPMLKNAQEKKTIVYWVSYMEGNQRILLFTQQESVFLKAKSIVDPEPSKREIFLSFAGVGISIVTKTNEILKELVYANVTDSAAHWELYFDKRWKSLSLELSAWIESKYAHSSKKAQLENFIDVDLVKMHMTKPFFGKLRRTYSPGIWLHCRKSMSLTYLQGYVHRIQIDNQIRNTTFPVILYSNLQKSIINYTGNHKLKHCVEFTCLKQRKLNYDVYKSICVIVREFDLNLQEGFLLSLIDLIPKKPETKHSIAAKLRKDVSSIPNIYNVSDIADYKNVIRFIFEYSEKGGSEKHAEFRLPYYQRNFITVDTDEILSDLSRSYVIQSMQQFHVLIRSTTVLGNQCGYNFRSPGDNFYDSNTLILCGDEIAEKLSYEVACQLGYATLDTTQVSVFNVNIEPRAVKMKESCIQNKDVPPLNPSIRTSFSTEIELETCSLVTAFISIEIFSMHKAKGMHLLSVINKNPGIETDVYWAHTVLSNDGKHIALVSLQRLYFIEKGCTWGSLNVKWTLETHQLLSPPTVVNNRLILHVNKNEDTLSPMVDWYLESEATDILEWLCQKINIAMILNMENSVCSKQIV